MFFFLFNKNTVRLNMPSKTKKTKHTNGKISEGSLKLLDMVFHKKCHKSKSNTSFLFFGLAILLTIILIIFLLPSCDLWLSSCFDGCNTVIIKAVIFFLIVALLFGAAVDSASKSSDDYECDNC